eukprot:CAMPEP_0170243600 /NCGR_PEP_ID=MMETSP0116_2-20130129/21576_1 /TAXON_ID=400756 /ORGANISM="Durinskia baltica, Strain CSIRO CS-38" /LENGTH=219 /DNA_ID=CAMNT_0010494455 /DNA_START=83 /DNA_END=743 /DNA_ORIENTATION=-
MASVATNSTSDSAMLATLAVLASEWLKDEPTENLTTVLSDFLSEDSNLYAETGDSMSPQISECHAEECEKYMSAEEECSTSDGRGMEERKEDELSGLDDSMSDLDEAPRGFPAACDADASIEDRLTDCLEGDRDTATTTASGGWAPSRLLALCVPALPGGPREKAALRRPEGRSSCRCEPALPPIVLRRGIPNDGRFERARDRDKISPPRQRVQAVGLI